MMSRFRSVGVFAVLALYIHGGFAQADPSAKDRIQMRRLAVPQPALKTVDVQVKQMLNELESASSTDLVNEDFDVQREETRRFHLGIKDPVVCRAFISETGKQNLIGFCAAQEVGGTGFVRATAECERREKGESEVFGEMIPFCSVVTCSVSDCLKGVEACRKGKVTRKQFAKIARAERAKKSGSSSGDERRSGGGTAGGAREP